MCTLAKVLALRFGFRGAGLSVFLNDILAELKAYEEYKYRDAVHNVETIRTNQELRSKLKNMIKSGDQFIAGRSGGVVGAIVPWHGAFAGVAPAHIFYAAGTRDLRLGNLSSKVAYIPNDADLAFFPIVGACQPTELGKPHLGDVELKNARHSMRCRISDTSWSIAYVVLPPGNLPGPGDSGSPLVQDGKVVGLLLSLNMHTWKGIAISAEMIKREMQP